MDVIVTVYREVGKIDAVAVKIQTCVLTPCKQLIEYLPIFDAVAVDAAGTA